MSVYPVHVWCPQRCKEDFGSSAIGITDYGRPLNECWKSKPGPHGLLTAEPSFQPHEGFLTLEAKMKMKSTLEPWKLYLPVTPRGVTLFCVFRREDNIMRRLLEIRLHLSSWHLKLYFLSLSATFKPLLWLSFKFHSEYRHLCTGELFISHLTWARKVSSVWNSRTSLAAAQAWLHTEPAVPFVHSAHWRPLFH